MKFFNLFRRKGAVPASLPPMAELPKVAKRVLQLADYLPRLAPLALPCIRIEAKPADSLFLFDSKLGGDPYWPAARPYPVDSEGKPLYLLAQINFSQLPALEGYPESGLLQFYLAADSVYGINFDHPTEQQNFRVVYHENTEAPGLDGFLFLNDEDRRDALPVERPMQLRFTLDTDYFSFSDVRLPEERIDEILADLETLEERQWMEDELEKAFPAGGHKMGGYAYFTQYDPRDDERYKDYILLLQVDSQLPHICWGDVGVGNFFIHPDDLRRKDFSRVLYNWDCT